MTDVHDLELDVYFGDMKSALVNWRDEFDPEDVDDEELDTTPPEVVGMLGFDPKDL